VISSVERRHKTESIKAANNIVAVIGGYVRLRKVGKQYTGCCPLPGHNDTRPSFVVRPDKALFNCFGCGEGGDVFRFIQLIERVDFKQARAILAARAGISTEERPFTREERREYARRKKLAEKEADELWLWIVGLVRALRARRDVYLRSYHRMLRYLIGAHATDDRGAERRGVAMDAAETYQERNEALDRAIEMFNRADYPTLLLFFRERKQGRKAEAAS
jgi:hypothetical protein